MGEAVSALKPPLATVAGRGDSVAIRAADDGKGPGEARYRTFGRAAPGYPAASSAQRLPGSAAGARPASKGLGRRVWNRCSSEQCLPGRPWADSPASPDLGSGKVRGSDCHKSGGRGTGESRKTSSHEGQADSRPTVPPPCGLGQPSSQNPSSTSFYGQVICADAHLGPG